MISMKRFFSLFLALSLMVSSAGALDLYFDGEEMELDVPAQIIDGRTMVPIGHIFNAFGAEVEWDGATRTATGRKDGTVVAVQIDNTTAYVNGEAVELDVPAQIVNERTMVPAWFVSTALGAKVYWDGRTQTVRIATKVYDVLRVVDGDTIVVDFNGTEEKVRLIGVDTPESVHPDSERNSEAGVLASDYTKERLEGKQVELEFDVQERDMYGRLLAYVWLDGVMYNKTLLEDGVANLATYPPNVKHVEEFTAIVEARNAQNEAREEQVQDGSQDAQEDPGAVVRYILNTGTMKFHYQSCSDVKRIAPENYAESSASREDLISKGYSACGHCNP